MELKSRISDGIKLAALDMRFQYKVTHLHQTNARFKLAIIKTL